jgi:glycosyltransferase involved in cell wall biosynthesis
VRLLFLTHNVMGHGGSYQRAFSLGRALANRGHHVTLMAGRARAGLRPLWSNVDGVQLIQPTDFAPMRLRHGGLSPLGVLSRLLLAPSLENDLIHTFDHRPAVTLPGWLAGRRLNVSIVSDWADTWGFNGIAASRPWLERVTLGRVDDWAERAWRRRVDGVTAINHHLADLAKTLLPEGSPIILLPAGSNSGSLAIPTKETARRSLGCSADDRIAAHIGFADYDESLLVRTLGLLAAIEPALRILTTGRPPAGLAGSLGAQGRRDLWRHLGRIPYGRLGTVLSAADVLLLPYSDRPVNRGRLPNKLGDYLAAGRPIVTNPTGDVGLLVESEEIGMVVQASPAAMAGATLWLFEHPEAAEAMGRRAADLGRGRLSWRALAGEVELFYERVAEIARRRQQPEIR